MSLSNQQINEIRQEFPILTEKAFDKQIVYFDNAATSQTPLSVINAMTNYYKHDNSNIHRGVHFLSQRATEKFENAREKVQHFIHAKEKHEVIFTKGTTEALNLLSNTFGGFIKEGDEMIVSIMEHHSNFVPWQQLCLRKGAKLHVLYPDETGEISVNALSEKINDKTKLLSLVHVSNISGVINPVKKLIAKAHEYDVPVIIDGAQAISHLAVDVQELDCDFYCFSAHKMFGSTGLGVLYGKEKWLEKLPPFHFGGEMVKKVSVEKTIFNELPYKFEAGTPPIAEVIALGAAIDFMLGIGVENIAEHENKLLNYVLEEFQQIDEMKTIGYARHKTSLVSFQIKDIHHYDAGSILNHFGIAVRTGHHCAEPFVNHLGFDGVARASFAVYNTIDEIDQLIQGIHQVMKMF